MTWTLQRRLDEAQDTLSDDKAALDHATSEHDADAAVIHRWNSLSELAEKDIDSAKALGVEDLAEAGRQAVKAGEDALEDITIEGAIAGTERVLATLPTEAELVGETADTVLVLQTVAALAEGSRKTLTVVGLALRAAGTGGTVVLGGYMVALNAAVGRIWIDSTLLDGLLRRFVAASREIAKVEKTMQDTRAKLATDADTIDGLTAELDAAKSAGQESSTASCSPPTSAAPATSTQPPAPPESTPPPTVPCVIAVGPNAGMSCYTG